MKIRNLWPLAALLMVMVAISSLWIFVIFAAAVIDPAGYQANIAPAAQVIDGTEIVFRIVTIILFGVWIYQSGTNLVAAGYDGLEFSPASRVWWFAVPVANLGMPYRGMRELWNVSRGTDAPDQNTPLLIIWWGAWLASSILSNIAARFTTNGDLLASLGMVRIVSGIAAILVIRGITAAQRELPGPDLVETFA